MLNYFYFFAPNTNGALVVAPSEQKQVPFSIAIGNNELMHEYFPKHSRMGKIRMKYNFKKTEEGKRGVSKERSTAGTKE